MDCQFRGSDRRTKRLGVTTIEAFAAQFSDVELFQNKEDMHTMRRFTRRREPTVVGNGTDLVRFRFDLEGRERIRGELGMRPDDLLVGAVGRRVAEKGMFEFAAAARNLGGRAVFIWVGPRGSRQT